MYTNNNIIDKFSLLPYGRGNNATMVKIGTTELYFSYQTIIAVYHKGSFIGCENIYSSTTGRHMSAIPGNDKKDRVNINQFEKCA